MTLHGLTLHILPPGLVLLAGSALLDALVHPRPARALRSWQGLALNTALWMTVFGAVLAICGNAWVACALALGLAALFAVASNAKNAMLGEPLLFSDLALIGAIFRHPQFYLSAVAPWQRAVAAVVALALLGLLALLFVAAPALHMAGLALLLIGLTGLTLALRSAGLRRITARPDAAKDVERHGLVPVILLYWRRWRESVDPPACPAVLRNQPDPAVAPGLVVMIQCESFADPAELFGDAGLALPGLAAARQAAWQHGRLNVSGFGAYTMRTEYGVLFGREEEALGFRRYDPFLTAHAEGSWALPARMGAAGWDSAFLHPHDMRFYGRDKIMPAGGFGQLVGEEAFAPPQPGEGRYVTDAAIADVIVAMAEAATHPTLLYAVTIENHGPWAGDEQLGLVPGYLRLVRNSDAMLSRLMDDMAQQARCTAMPSALVFFGDHCPSIPGATAPGGDRHTPYVIVRFGSNGQPLPGNDTPVDLTPAALHHAVLDMALGAPR